MAFRRWFSVALVGVLLASTYVATGSAIPADSVIDERTSRPVPDRPSHTVDFSDARAHAVGGGAFASAAVPGDVTGDGRADAVVRDPGADSGKLRIYAHNGDTAGNPWTSFASADGEWDFADVLLLGDVTGDGQTDVVARDPAAAGGTLWVYPYDTSKEDDPWPSRFSAGTGWNDVNTIMLGDVTGDDLPDLVARDPRAAAGTLWIYAHDGSTASNPWSQPRAWAGTGWNLADALTLADVNGDDHLDVLARDGSGALWVYPHDGVTSGNPYTSRYSAGTGWGFATTVLAADATGDGHPDVVARSGDGAMWIYPHDGSATGNPYTGSRFSAGTGWNVTNLLAAGDVSGDGRPDLVARVHAGDMWVYPNDDTTDVPWTDRFEAGSQWGFEDSLLLGDVTGDGRPDVVARDPSASNGTMWVYPNNGSTTSNPWTTDRVWAGIGWNDATATMLGDITGDGWSDVVIRDRDGDLWVYPHNGSSTGNPWTTKRSWAGTGWNTATSLALGDVNGDDVPDLVDLEKDGSLWIYVTGSSGGPIGVEGDWTSTDLIALGDVDGDGRLDLVTRETTGELWIHPHDGSDGTNPWTSRKPAGSDWGFASAFLL